jgi:hypothetical protein
MDIVLSVENHSGAKVAKYYDIYNIGQILSLLLLVHIFIMKHIQVLPIASLQYPQKSVSSPTVTFQTSSNVVRLKISYPMTSYIVATDATMSLLKKLRKQNRRKVVLSPISLRFTASTPANLSMSYGVNPSESGWCYMEMPSLLSFYRSIQNYDDISKPHSEQSIKKFQVQHFPSFI